MTYARKLFEEIKESKFKPLVATPDGNTLLIVFQDYTSVMCNIIDDEVIKITSIIKVDGAKIENVINCIGEIQHKAMVTNSSMISTGLTGNDIEVSVNIIREMFDTGADLELWIEAVAEKARLICKYL